ncbi:MAG: isoprenylcysteine carboxylmethyltransferase family protein [Caldilineae bacterium]|nr:MAG: isoprenylcysteine carboxylmethyltransferase family protein [Caldilineae bacterium]
MSADSKSVLHAWLLKARIPASIVMAATILLLARPTPQSMILGSVLIAAGESLRIWASGHIHKLAEVTQTGPYALCRHPLYLGHFIITLGFCLAAASLWASAIVIPAFFLVYMPTWKNEERYLLEKFGKVYRDYMASTPALLPKPGGAWRSGSFDWALVRKHREWNHILLILLGLALLLAIGIHQGGI